MRIFRATSAARNRTPAALPGRRRGSARAAVARCLALAGALAAFPAAASAQLTLAGTWEGPYDIVSTGSSLRTQANGNGNSACTVGTSTTATLTVPTGATVVAAYLYWAGSGSLDGSVTLNGNTINAARSTLEPYVNNGSTLNFFGAVADVTSRVTGSGTYTFAGLGVTNTDPYCASAAVVAGFSLYAVVRLAGTPAPRRVQIRDGFEVVRSSTSTVTLNGFVGAATPSVKVTALTWEGDPDITGTESMRVNGTTLGTGTATTNLWQSSGAGGASPYGLDLESFTTTIPAGATTATVDVISGTDLILLQTVTTSIAVANSYGVVVTPDGLGTPVQRLPGANYTQTFKIKSLSNVSTVYDLRLSATGNPFFITPQSYTGNGITATAAADSFFVTLAAGDSTFLIATYTVPMGPNAINTGYVRARVRAAPTVFDDGWAEVERVVPQLTLTKSVTATAGTGPGADLTYNIAFSNAGQFAATQVQVTDLVPTQVAFKLASFTQTLPTGLTVAVAYSNDGGTSWTYTPVSGACAQPAGYDGCVNRIRWTLSGPLPAGSGSNGTLRFVARVRPTLP